MGHYWAASLVVWAGLLTSSVFIGRAIRKSDVDVGVSDVVSAATVLVFPATLLAIAFPGIAVLHDRKKDALLKAVRGTNTIRNADASVDYNGVLRVLSSHPPWMPIKDDEDKEASAGKMTPKKFIENDVELYAAWTDPGPLSWLGAVFLVVAMSCLVFAPGVAVAVAERVAKRTTWVYQTAFHILIFVINAPLIVASSFAFSTAFPYINDRRFIHLAHVHGKKAK